MQTRIMNPIPREFFTENDTLWLAKNLLGKLLFCNTDSYGLSAGIITETEAYLGATDRASHAWNNRRTIRTETMFQSGGISYVYLCYGMHHLFNIVTNHRDIPHAILIRGIKPIIGLENIMKRMNTRGQPLTDGPGKLTRALGINTTHDKTPLDGKLIWLEDHNIKTPDNQIYTGPRIGVDYAGEDAQLPLRFLINDLQFLNQITQTYTNTR
jgi:DNA-3-methyladenine glycosylase